MGKGILDGSRAWPRPAPLTRALMAWCLGVLVCLNLGDALTEPALWEALPPLLDAKLGRDSWHAMVPAYAHVRAGGAEPVYTAIYFDQENGFQYPPTSLLVFTAMEALGIGAPDWEPALDLLTIACFWLYVVLVLRLTVSLMGTWGGLPLAQRPADRILLGAGAVIACLTFYPATQGLANGQAQVWITAAMALALWCWWRGRDGAAGACLALAAMVKPHFGLLLAWGVLRGRWRYVAAFVATLATGLALSLWCYGLEQHLNYLDAINFMSRHPNSKMSNQSLAGLLQRLRGHGTDMAWVNLHPPYHPGVHVASVLFGLGMVGLALAAPLRHGRPGGLVDLAIMILTVTAASPIAWRHHYAILLPIYVVIVALLAGQPARRRLHVGLLALSYLATGTLWGLTWRWTDTPFSVLQAHGFFGALLALALLYDLRGLEPAAGPAPGPVSPEPARGTSPGA